MMRNTIFVVIILVFLLAGCAEQSITQTQKEPVNATQQTQQVQEVKETKPVQNTTAKTEPKPSTDLKVYFMDVGEGDSTLFKKGDTAILIDCGQTAKIDYLKSLGVKNIDLLIITHPDAEHIGGCDDILRNFNVSEVWDNGQVHGSQAYKDYVSIARNRNTAKVGMSKVLEGIQIHVLHSNMGSSKSNENSVVTRVTLGEIDFLMMADCESSCEGAINGGTASEIFRVANHGNRASTAMNFLREVNPEVSIISVGADNPYGDPDPITLEKLKNTEIYRTDLNGNIVITTDGETYSVETQYLNK
ncbi:MBL fold metallo-hydrolase [Candidatus Woesearchaeota archaeon]|nr:MBL fold metallo-hydrolase [Candidatus Woesearchaeota archaeon]